MIVTPRLVLARPTLADLDDSHAMTRDPAVMRFLGTGPATREEAWNRLLRNIGHWTAFGWGIFTVREADGGDFVGEVGLANFTRGLGDGFDGVPEAAWVLSAAAHGRGYAGEAVAAAHAWLDGTLAPARTVCIIDPGNAPSLRVAARLGYAAFGEAEYRGGRPLTLERRRDAPHAAAGSSSASSP